MGHIAHHTIVVTSWRGESIKSAQLEARRTFGSNAVSSVKTSIVNSYYSFFVAPDGSKEGWTESDLGDGRRKRFIDWMKDREHPERNASLEWVEVCFGRDVGKSRITGQSPRSVNWDRPLTKARTKKPTARSVKNGI